MASVNRGGPPPGLFVLNGIWNLDLTVPGTVTVKINCSTTSQSVTVFRRKLF